MTQQLLITLQWQNCCLGIAYSDLCELVCSKQFERASLFENQELLQHTCFTGADGTLLGDAALSRAPLTSRAKDSSRPVIAYTIHTDTATRAVGHIVCMC